MLKKTITYTDYNGNKRTEDFWFNLNKSELVELGLSKNGGLDVMLQRIIKEQNAPEIIKVLKEILFKAYGEKSDDGKYFRKSEDISNNFFQTEAYNELFMEIFSSPEKSIAFFKGILPQDLQNEIKENEIEEAKNNLLTNA